MDGIVDAHHHIWRQRDLPWLEGPMQPRIFGPYDAIRRDYPIEEYLGDIAGSGVARSVYVQANWAPARAVDEVAWVQAEAERSGFPHAIVGYADLRDPNVGAVLRAQARYPLLRGIRMQLHWHENAQYRFADGPAPMRDAALRRHVGLLADHGLLFELQVFSGQMQDGAAFAEAFPEIPMVLAHCGMPEDLRPAGWAAWRRRHDAPRRRARRVRQALGPRHLHPPARCGPCRAHGARDRRPLRPGALPLGQQLPDREAVDRLCEASSTPTAGRWLT